MSVLPKDIPTTAASAAADDYVHLNGATNKSRKYLAALWATLVSPTFTGVPKAPTPTGAENKALVTVDYLPSAPVSTLTAAALTTLMQTTLYPVGEILITHRAGNPNTWLGFGTWVAYGAGKVLVGLDTGDTDFDAIDDTGGTKTHTISANNLPTHTHSIPALSGTTNDPGTHTHTVVSRDNQGSTAATVSLGGAGTTSSVTTSASGAHTHTVTTTASNTGNNTTTATAVNHMNPYITVAMWRRTA